MIWDQNKYLRLEHWMAEASGTSTLALETRQLADLATEGMSAVVTGQPSSVETGQMSAVWTTQPTSAETRQIYNSEKGQCPV